MNPLANLLICYQSINELAYKLFLFVYSLTSVSSALKEIEVCSSFQGLDLSGVISVHKAYQCKGRYKSSELALDLFW